MTDNSDLLGATAPSVGPAPVIRKRGRPPTVKAKPVVPASTNPVVVGVDLGKAGGDLTATVTAEVLPNGALNILDMKTEAVKTPFDEATKKDAPSEEEQIKDALSAPEVPLEEREAANNAALVAALASKNQPAGLVSVPNADGSVSVELPPVSADYALAQATRVTIIGQSPREYAYKRVLRSGKRL